MLQVVTVSIPMNPEIPSLRNVMKVHDFGQEGGHRPAHLHANAISNFLIIYQIVLGEKVICC